ncbi:MAG TPA: hypothetical protein VI030_10215 [Propionibacteriaceae bacterium]
MPSPGLARPLILDQAAVAALSDAERGIPRPTDLERIRTAVIAVRSKINSKGNAVDGSSTRQLCCLSAEVGVR